MEISTSCNPELLKSVPLFGLLDDDRTARRKGRRYGEPASWLGHAATGERIEVRMPAPIVANELVGHRNKENSL
jgi:hypothetical protein